MKTEKTPNYTAAQEQLIRDAIAANGGKGNKTVAETLAADPRMNGENGPRNYRSIIAKMSRMGVDYERKVPTAKDGSPIEKKTELVAEIASLVGVSVAKLDGMDKSPKLALQTVRDALAAATGTDG